MRVTIGLPFHNNRHTIINAVRSVFAQSFSDWELILIDDGSTDGSLQHVQKIRDSRVKIIFEGKNRGLSYRLNQIAQLAQGKYLARMDADDLMHPNRIENQVKFLDKNTKVQVVSTGAYTIDASNNVVGKRPNVPLPTNNTLLLEKVSLIHPTVMGRLEWFKKNPYDSRFPRAEDHELWCRTYNAAEFGKLSEPLLFYREDGSFELKKYLQTCKTDRLILKIYGQPSIGRLETAWLIAKNIIKGEIYRAFTFLGLQKWLIAKRNITLTEIDSRDVANNMEKIINTLIPGFDKD
ncbi:MAG: hypothetical protein VR67_18980 [Peptococcaceae bacterium BRH_c8a]|nr:MAG: hypothetical protein VR67_18980 [Peptococcaceae bacterium BRH_c8a]